MPNAHALRGLTPEIYAKYKQQGLTDASVAELYGVGRTAIVQWRKRNNIETSISARRISHKDKMPADLTGRDSSDHYIRKRLSDWFRLQAGGEVEPVRARMATKEIEALREAGLVFVYDRASYNDKTWDQASGIGSGWGTVAFDPAIDAPGSVVRVLAPKTENSHP